jgi:RNA polymerase sigma factor for flagellar operon FliA
MSQDSPVEPVSDLNPQPGASGGLPAFAAGYRVELDETEIIVRHVPLVKRIASHLKGRLPESVQLDDLIQSGLMAVLRITRHEGGRQPPEASLRRSIMNAMIDETRRQTWAPVRTVRLAKGAASAMRAIKRRTGRDGSDEEVAAEMGLPLPEYHRALVEIAGLRLLQLDDCDEAAEERLQVTERQEQALDRSRMMTALAEAITALPERERIVVSLYYEHELNMDEIGNVLGVNKSTVCRSHGRALLMLRSALGDWVAAGVAGPETGD